jgi:hypothetical protein
MITALLFLRNRTYTFVVLTTQTLDLRSVPTIAP